MNYETIPVTHYQQNCSVVWCESTRDAVVIDPGGDLDRIHSAIARNELRVVRILLTHGHMDHVGGTADLAASLNVPVVGPHIDDRFWIDGLDAQAARMGFAAARSFEPSRWLQDGDVERFGECELAVLHCPGHTPGHVVFINEPAKLAFVGDVLFNGSIGRTDFPRGNHAQLIDSIRRKLFTVGDDIRFVPGHGPESTFGEERRHNPFVADTRFG